MLNTVTVMGRICADTELRYTQSKAPVLSFTVAVDRDYKTQDGERATDFIDCVAWHNKAEFISKFFSKGSMIIVSGALQTRTWEDKNGGKHKACEVNVENIYFGEPKRREE